MLRRGIIAAAAIFLIAAAPIHSPSDSNQRSDNYQEYASDNVNGRNQPIVVRIYEPKRSKEDSDREQRDHDERAQTDGWMVRLTGLIAAATIMQAIILAITIGTSLKQLRPYVSAVPHFIQTFDHDSFAVAKTLVKNRGVTPAFHVQVQSDIQVFSEPLPQIFQFPALTTQWSHPFALFPDGEMDVTATASRKFEQQEIDRLVGGKLSLYVFGIARYKRFRFFWHHTRFAARLNMAEADLRSLVKKTDRTFPVAFVTAHQHNDAT